MMSINTTLRSGVLLISSIACRPLVALTTSKEDDAGTDNQVEIELSFAGQKWARNFGGLEEKEAGIGFFPEFEFDEGPEPSRNTLDSVTLRIKGDDAWAARILGVRDAVTDRTGVTVVDTSVQDLRERAELEVRARLGPDRWARSYTAGRKASIDALLADIDRATAR